MPIGVSQTQLVDQYGNPLLAVPTRAQQNAGADANTAASTDLVAIGLYNGATLDRAYANTTGTLLASAVRNASTTSPAQTNFNARGVLLWFNITAVPGTDTVTLILQSTDPLAGHNAWLLQSAAFSAVNPHAFLYYPGQGANSNLDGVADGALPRPWQVTIQHSNNTNFTYSLSYALIN